MKGFNAGDFVAFIIAFALLALAWIGLIYLMRILCQVGLHWICFNAGLLIL